AAWLSLALSPIPQQSAYYLAGRRHRHVVDEGDLARICMSRQTLFDKVLNFGRQRIGRRYSVLEHNEGLDDFGAQRIGLSHRGGERHRGVADEAVLDFARSDAIA